MPFAMGNEGVDMYDSHTRKRVGKACDRCRLKKSKCDGAHPCTRCRLDNTICYYGERKKSVDKVYPKGYVEILELQQAQLVSGLRKAFSIMLQCNNFPGGALSEQEDGYPLTHDILERLDVLNQPDHNHEGHESNFEDDLEKIQQDLTSQQQQQQQQQSRSLTTTTYGDTDSGSSSTSSSHIDSPQQVEVSSPTDSWVSSKSPRKRSFPFTPPQAPQLEMHTTTAAVTAAPLVPVMTGSKRSKMTGFEFCSTLNNFNQMPISSDPIIIMGSPQSYASTTPDMLQFNNNTSSNGRNGTNTIGIGLTFPNGFENLDTTWQPSNSYNMDIFAVNSDPDFETFMQSGFHS